MCDGLRGPALRAEMTEIDIGVPDWLSVSSEVKDKLVDYHNLVLKWNPRINLISAASVQQAWVRHVLDSAQLWPLADVRQGIWLDIGSGGGFPGLVISILAQADAPDVQVVLVESDRRKSVFLSEAVRQLELAVDVRCQRVETLSPLGANVVSARALAPLADLLGLISPQLAPSGVALLPKGQRYRAELAECRKRWSFEACVTPSKTDADAAILQVRNVTHD